MILKKKCLSNVKYTFQQFKVIKSYVIKSHDC